MHKHQENPTLHSPETASKIEIPAGYKQVQRGDCKLFDRYYCHKRQEWIQIRHASKQLGGSVASVGRVCRSLEPVTEERARYSTLSFKFEVIAHIKSLFVCIFEVNGVQIGSLPLSGPQIRGLMSKFAPQVNVPLDASALINFKHSFTSRVKI